MKIAINILPLKTAHKDRGIGFYTSNLIENLKKDPQIELQEFINLSEIKEVDIVHYPWFDFFFNTLPIIKKAKTVVTIHDVIPLLFPNNYPVGLRGKYNLFLQKLALKRCDHIITDSRVSKNDIYKALRINEKKISVVRLAANKSFMPQKETQLLRTKRKYNLPDKFLLYVGEANWVKNLPFLIQGFNTLIKSPDFKDLRLALIGGVFLKKVENINHPELESLKKFNQLITDYNLEKNIIRTGDLDLEDLVSFYNLATVYIQPSLYEGFGLPMLEAFSCGTPVLSSDQGSLPEIGGSAPIYFNPTNLNQFVSLLVGVLRDKTLQNKLIKLGLEQSLKYSWEKVTEETKQIYSKVINYD